MAIAARNQRSTIEGPAVECVDVRRVFDGPVEALGGVSLSIPAGEVFGLLGPNGAGKTTLVRIISTLLTPTSGTAMVAGRDVVREAAAVRRHLGLVLAGDGGLYGRLSAVENLEYFAILGGLRRTQAKAAITRLISRVGLVDAASRPVESFSSGMKQRLHIARALLTDPDVLIMDEPTSALDPVAAADVRTLVTELRAENRCIVLTTHLMAEADKVCDRVAIISRGKVVAIGSPHQLRTGGGRFKIVEFVLEVPISDLAKIATMSGVLSATAGSRDGSQLVTLSIEESAGVLEQVRHWAAENQASAFVAREPTLEEAYVRTVSEA
jgi:ABC-2 type transport system ATP-binding protein